MRFVDDVARRFGPQDVVIFEQPRSIHLLSLPLWAVHGVNALELARFNPDPERLQHLVARVARALPQHLLRPHLQHRPVRPVPAARRGAFASAPSSGSAPTAARRGARSSSPCASRSRAWCSPEELQVPAAARGGRRRLRRRPGLRLLRQGRRRRPHLPLDGLLRVVYLPGARGPAAPSPSPSSAGRRPADAAGARPREPGRHGRSGAFTAGPDWEEHRLRAARPAAAGPARPAPRRAGLAARQHASRAPTTCATSASWWTASACGGSIPVSPDAGGAPMSASRVLVVVPDLQRARERRAR